MGDGVELAPVVGTEGEAGAVPEPTGPTLPAGDEGYEGLVGYEGALVAV
jgi:hypothetical protein